MSERTTFQVDVYWRGPFEERKNYTCEAFTQRSHVYVLDLVDGTSEYLPIDLIERVVVHPVEEKG